MFKLYACTAFIQTNYQDHTFPICLLYPLAQFSVSQFSNFEQFDLQRFIVEDQPVQISGEEAVPHYNQLWYLLIVSCSQALKHVFQFMCADLYKQMYNRHLILPSFALRVVHQQFYYLLPPKPWHCQNIYCIAANWCAPVVCMVGP